MQNEHKERETEKKMVIKRSLMEAWFVNIKIRHMQIISWRVGVGQREEMELVF